MVTPCRSTFRFIFFLAARLCCDADATLPIYGLLLPLRRCRRYDAATNEQPAIASLITIAAWLLISLSFFAINIICHISFSLISFFLRYIFIIFAIISHFYAYFSLPLILHILLCHYLLYWLSFVLHALRCIIILIIMLMIYAFDTPFWFISAVFIFIWYCFISWFHYLILLPLIILIFLIFHHFFFSSLLWAFYIAADYYFIDADYLCRWCHWYWLAYHWLIIFADIDITLISWFLWCHCHFAIFILDWSFIVTPLDALLSLSLRSVSFLISWLFSRRLSFIDADWLIISFRLRHCHIFMPRYAITHYDYAYFFFSFFCWCATQHWLFFFFLAALRRLRLCSCCYDATMLMPALMITPCHRCYYARHAIYAPYHGGALFVSHDATFLAMSLYRLLPLFSLLIIFADDYIFIDGSAKRCFILILRLFIYAIISDFHIIFCYD